MVATLATSQNPLKKTLFVAAAGEADRKNERWMKFSVPPPLPMNANVCFCRFFNLIPCMTKLKVLVLCFPYG